MSELALPKKRKVSHKGSRHKGSKFEREISAMYRSTGLDPTATRMPLSGGLAFHKGDILKKNDPEFVDEAKCQETTKLWEWWAQAVSQCHGQQKPVLHIKRNFSEPLSVIRMSDYFQLRLELKQLREQLGL